MSWDNTSGIAIIIIFLQCNCRLYCCIGRDLRDDRGWRRCRTTSIPTGCHGPTQLTWPRTDHSGGCWRPVALRTRSGASRRWWWWRWWWWWWIVVPQADGRTDVCSDLVRIPARWQCVNSGRLACGQSDTLMLQQPASHKLRLSVLPAHKLNSPTQILQKRSVRTHW